MANERSGCFENQIIEKLIADDRDVIKISCLVECVHAVQMRRSLPISEGIDGFHESTSDLAGIAYNLAVFADRPILKN